MVVGARRPLSVGSDGVGSYLASISAYAVLTREEVATLCRAIEVGVLASDRALQPDLTPSDVQDLLVLQRSGQRAMQRLIAHNLKLVVATARRIAPRTAKLDDLIQAGNAGLLIAVQRFDWRLGYTFSTYATWWIRKYVTTELANDRLIRLPAAQLRLLLQLGRMEQELAQTSERRVSSDELAAESGVAREQVEHLRRVGGRAVSLQQRLGDESDTALHDVLIDDVPEIADELHERELVDELRRALKELDEVQLEVLTLRFGLRGQPPCTPRRAAQLLHLPYGEVARVEQDALETIGAHLHRFG